MGSTYISFSFHFVWATKERRNLIVPEWEPRLHSFLGGVLKNLGGVPEIINGTRDHIHLLAGLRATHCAADVMRDLKSLSSEWVHKELKVWDFGWQDGYFGATVSPTQRPSVRRYIQNQKEHHKTESSKEELERLLKRAGIEYDPQYFE